MQHDTGQDEDNTVTNLSMSSPSPIVNKVELAKILNCWPIFGASAPLGDPAATPPAGPADPSATPPPGGSAPTDDPIAKLVADPAAITQLLAQVTELQNAVTLANDKISGYETKETEAARALQTREEQLATDLDNLKAEVAKRDNIIKAKTIENAIRDHGEYQWNSTRQMMAELDLDSLDVNIDIDKGIAEVKGLGDKLKTVAEKNPWLLKVADPAPTDTPPAGNPPARQRSSGQPPRPPAAPQDKDAKRREVMKRMPVLASGRGRPM